MFAATIVYPHQLFKHSPAISDDRRVYLVEEPLILTHNPTHRQRLMLHKLSMDSYEQYLVAGGHDVTRLKITRHPNTIDVFNRLRSDGVTELHIVDTTDCYLERAIVGCGIKRVWYESPMFVLPLSEARDRFVVSKRFMASFYKQLRKDKHILVDEHNEPIGGQWSFDADNRKKIPRDTELPADITKYSNADIKAAEQWTEQVEAEKYGEAGCWLPYTHATAQEFLQEFLRSRFQNFGPYEDAMAISGVRLWHSTLSPLLNIGLLTPQDVLDQALEYTKRHEVPTNSLEGFVRQILGWREFIRASYEVDGDTMRQQNFFNHTRTLSNAFWTGSTAVEPVDHAIKATLQFAYNHHIERLMVMGNFMLLSQINPHDVYRWFMGMYIDAYDWVMVPNVYGMSQFADGGSFATKPYISGANYIKKMSDYPKGAGDHNWEETWTALYWNFVSTHYGIFKKNHRMSMMPNLLDRMKEDAREKHLDVATKFLAKQD